MVTDKSNGGVGMEREELLEHLGTTYDVVKEFEDLDSEKYKLTRRRDEWLGDPTKISGEGKRNLYLVGSYLVIYLLLFGSSVYDGVFGDHNFFIKILLAFWYIALLSGLGFLYKFLFKAIGAKIVSKKTFYLEKISEVENDIYELEQQQTELAEDIMNFTDVPEDYLTSDIVGRFHGYVSNRRADTLKECINLFEQERVQNNMKRELEAANKQIAEMAQKIGSLDSSLKQ
ncbi:hypothetical protein [Paenibacillus sp. LHD-38]|uniref:hypothetical protein n=1 Tax=Paenibacillus sp. LHD-38 TaxID=3072143 RepID=UPI00280E0D55|nr:hypothetical protein [Paenibacillus sp. LHD-38]MDQ8734238.1 hypothetical protein [Paenibacillus sp. LHD-38]